ncbi:acyltransferase family protein [Escherichia coli]|uniref:acyltransferase family protein n=1 Tax=Escherichia coli TaxID=562 RepID=UPI001C1466E8|nr:acyltransferase family protein [Escherichia coli]HBE5125306.1 acyltransferase family protein [Escherichia coli]
MNLDSVQQRDAINYAKAFGIMCVVIGHFPNSIFNIMTPYMFHMPLFFFIGGILFKEKSWRDFSVVILNKFVVYIASTFIIISLFTLILINIFGFSNLPNPLSWSLINIFVTTYKENFHNNSLFLVAWFLFAYMIAMTMLNFVCKLTTMLGIKNSGILISLIGIASGWFAIDYISADYRTSGDINLNYLCEFLVAFMFMSLGKVISFSVFNYISTTNATLFFLILVTLKYAGMASDISMSWSVYNHGFIDTMIQVFLCIYIVFYLSSVFSKSVKSQIILAIGKNTKPIMSYHLLIFFIVDIVLQWLMIGDYKNSTALSGHNQQAPYWALYVSCAILIPVIASKAYSSARVEIMNIFSQSKAP